MSQSHHNLKYLNYQKWTVDQVAEWLKGIRGFTEVYVSNFRRKEVNGKTLSLIDLDDLNELIPDNLNQKLITLKSIQNLINIRHDIQHDTLQSIMFKLVNKFRTMSNYLEKIQQCPLPECVSCSKLSSDIIKQTSQLATLYRKLITWLVRLPFTKMKKFELFRDDINFKMKSFLKIIRKKLNENQADELRQMIAEIRQNLCDMLDYFDANCEKENGKVSVAFNYTHLEKVQLRKSRPDQELGVSLINLVDGVYTIAEITRESAADECIKLNVEDDIIAVNGQVVIGWDVYKINQILNNIFGSCSPLVLLLRKMPKDHLVSIKQQNQNKNKFYLSSENAGRKNSVSKHQRKLSFSDIFVADEYIDSSEEESSEEDEYKEDVDFSQTKAQSITENLNELSNEQNDSRNETMYEKQRKKGFINFKKSSKLAYKSKANRLIKSMQNLLLYDRSRSNSADSLSNMDTKPKKSKNFLFNDSNSESSSKLDMSSSGKSETTKSIFSAKKWDISTSSLSKKQSSSVETDSADSPSLINLKRLEDDFQSKNSKISSKPPLSKRAVKAKPTIQGWLNINKYSINSSNSNLNKLNQNTAIKLRHYWCVLVKDYIAFYKNPDDKTPKDFILLKDFNISISNRRKDGFVIFDKVKQVEQEFYADCAEVFKEWYQCLVDIRSRIGNETTLSQSSTSLTSNFDSTYMQDTDSYFVNSESDAENRPHSKKYATQRSCPVNSSILAAASAGLVTKTNMGSPSSANSNIVHFEYDEKNQSTDSEQSYSRANSLPGSLQFCVGSLMESCSNTTGPSTNLNHSIVNKNLTGLSGSPKSSTSSQPNSPNLSVRQNSTQKMDGEVSQAPKLNLTR
ncbi:Beta-mannosidase [Brachionus plicatilis]|uniref:Beta-mannosidase n=1 Tax=Brachionus plicatilis TaxID=10195 RepID=A0A3M7S6T2_BRAPC|nr:Beta-mannosidase [Brachionus plicatilis]